MNRIPVIDMTATGINITRLRVNAGLTVKDLQDIFGFSTPQAIYKWQRGTALPTVDNLVVLAAVFGVKIDDIRNYSVQPHDSGQKVSISQDAMWET
jgi:transcriptional regulator with XRE-family HTH domain